MGRRVERTRNYGKLTEAQYWGKVRNALRKAFAAWEPASQSVKQARRPYKGPNRRQKFEVQCAHCQEWFAMKEIARDHIEPVGSLKCLADLAPFLQRLTPEDVAAFQPLCEPCHHTKTQLDNKRTRGKSL